MSKVFLYRQMVTIYDGHGEWGLENGDLFISRNPTKKQVIWARKGMMKRAIEQADEGADIQSIVYAHGFADSKDVEDRYEFAFMIELLGEATVEEVEFLKRVNLL